MTKHFNLIINEDVWNVYLVPDEDTVISEEDSAADTSIKNKEMFFRRGEVTLKNVLHEIWHVYFSYSYLSDTTEMTTADVEEVSAALYADKEERMRVRANEIYKKLIEMRDTDET